MRDLIELKNFWHAHAGAELALCTLVRKTGSAYRAVGAKKIVVRAEGACGLLSGGCLEPDIERTARENWGQLPLIQTFSTLSPEDKLLGYQLGCAGAIEVLCEKLPVNLMESAMDLRLPYGPQPHELGVAVSLAPATLAQRRWATAADQAGPDLFIDPWQVPLHLTVIGCGIDALPYAELAPLLGWNIGFLDYRDSLRDNLPPSCNVRIAPLAALPALIPAGPRSAVLLMTHNYQADLALLQALARRPVGYIGSLGPRARFEQMKAEVTDAPPGWDSILYTPAGLFTGSHTPVSIALSVVAQIEALLHV